MDGNTAVTKTLILCRKKKWMEIADKVGEYG
jgi:hypothetical protein